MILALALSPSVDVTYVVDALPAGGQARPDEVHRVAGGKAINAARAAAALGGTVRLLAALGGRSGEEVADGIAGAGIGLRAVATGIPTRTCVSVFSRATGELTEIYEHAPSIASAWHEVLRAVAEELGDAPAGAPGWVLLSGSLPETGDPDPLGAIATRVAAAGARLAIDTHGPALRRALELDPPPALVKVNRAEAAAALDAPAASASELASALQARTGGIAVVTDGEAGSAAAAPDGAWVARLPGVRGGFPVGSGDSFLGALLTALDDGTPPEPLPAALALAAAAATANALVPGAAVFDLAEVERLRRQVDVRPVGA